MQEAAPEAPVRNPLIDHTTLTRSPPTSAREPTLGPNSAPGDSPPPAGTISRYIDTWKCITSNNFVLSIVKDGYKIRFNSSNLLYQTIVSNPLSSARRKALQQQIHANLQSGAISQVPFSNDQYVSRVFTVKKSNGLDRMIIDLSNFNLLVPKVSFRMDSLDTIKSLLDPNDFMVSIDLSNDFFTIPLHASSKRFTTFEFNNIRYSYNVLPFGLTCSPRIFTKVLRPAIVYLRSCGLKISAYLDDIFICAPSFEKISSDLTTALSLLSSLGFHVNVKKSHLTPTTTLLHLGYVWDSSNMSLSLPFPKIQKTTELASHLLSQTHLSFRSASSFLGLVVSHVNGFPLAPLYYRAFQLDFLSQLQRSSSWDASFIPTRAARTDLSWWSSCPPVLPPLQLIPPAIDVVM